jgi:outer membrane usher protein
MWIRWVAVAVACSILSARILAVAPAATHSDLEEIWLASEINGQELSDVALFLRSSAGGVLAPLAQMKAWRLRIPEHATISHNNEQYVPLDAMKGLSYSIDENRQALLLRAPAQLFEQVTLSVTQESSVVTPRPSLGGFLNYELAGAVADSHTSLTGLIDGSLFGPAGTGVMRYLARRDHQETRAIRLDSTWTVDNPETLSSLRLGDSITGSSAWGGAARFGGIQWASNYAVRPGFITMPLPGASGESDLPSSLNLYVDNMLRMQSNLPSGPFRINDVPVVTGEGDIRLVVRDLLGREQVITEPFYASPELLRKGLHEYSFETGFTREDFGIASNVYGRPLIVATDRVGLTDQLTAETHGEFLRDQQTVGASAATRWATLGVLDASIAASHSHSGAGELIAVGFNRSARRLSLGAHLEYATRAFTRLGVLPGQPVLRMENQLFAAVGLGHLGSVSVSRTRQDYYDGHALDIVSARDSINAGWLGYITVSLTHTVAGIAADNTIAISLTHSIDSRRSMDATATNDSSGTATDFELQQSLPAGRGIGYRLIADTGAMRGADGTLDVQTDTGGYELEASKQADSTLARVFASGGFALVDRHIFASREIDDSFAVVQVGNESSVRIYRENQLVGQTNAAGYMLVPGLRAYQDNLIRIEQADLPLDVVLNNVQAQATPYFHSGVMLRFPVEHPRGALISVRLENGEPLPVGVLVRLTNQQEEFPSGTNGEVYVTGLADSNELHAEWGGKSCRFTVLYSPTSDPLPRLGPYVCRSDTP